MILGNISICQYQISPANMQETPQKLEEFQNHFPASNRKKLLSACNLSHENKKNGA